MADINAIADAISNTLSPDATRRRGAENFLSQRESDTTDFPLLILQLVANNSIPDHIRQASAVYLKNVTSRSYSVLSSEEEEPSSKPKHAQSFDRIKTSLIDIMLAVSTPIRRPLGEVLSCIADSDHPQRWPNLVSSLTGRLQSMMTNAEEQIQQNSNLQLITLVDWNTMASILETLNSIFERYPERMRSDELYTEINHSLKNCQQQILLIFNCISNIIQTNDQFDQFDISVTKNFLNTCNTLCRIFYNLSWQDLPEFFEDNINHFMSSLNKLLNLLSQKIDKENQDNDEPSSLDIVHSQVLEIANLYATKYDEEFRKFLPQFMSDAWKLLMHRGNSIKYDIVVTTGIKFLSSVARSPDSHLFSEPNALSGVCNRIVLPNIQLREEDVEMFEDDPREYVRHDLEGSDTGTRRRSAVELVKALCVRYEKEVTEIFSSFVQSIFSPSTDWRERDTAIYLVIALGWKTGTLMRGVTETSSLIDISHFFNSFVKDQLVQASSNPTNLASPIFTADLIKFVIAFRHQISIQGCKDALLACGKLIECNEQVVRTYSAACIERILTMKQDETKTNNNNNKLNGNTNTNGNMKKLEYRISKNDVVPILPSIVPLIVKALKEIQRPDEYMMRLVLRLCSFCRDGMSTYVESLLPTLVDLLVAATANPANPLFNHYLFESFAALIRFNANMNTISGFENALMNPLCNILIADVTEFGPYVFQILAQMMNVHEVSNTHRIPEQYTGLMNPILNPSMWERRAYIAAMVLYIETYVQKASAELKQNKQLAATLGVFQKLIASKATDHYGLHLLGRIFESMGIQDLSSYIQQIFNALMLRLSSAKTSKYVYHLIVCLSTFILRFGMDITKQAFDGIQKDVLAMLIKQVWLTDVVKIRDSNQRKICAIALSEMACGSSLCLSEPYQPLWSEMVTVNVALVEGIVVDDVKAEEEALEEEENEEVGVLVGAAETYASSQSLLRWGLGNHHGRAQAESLIEGKDARAVVFVRVVQFVEQHKDVFEPILQGKVSPEARKALSGYESVAKASST